MSICWYEYIIVFYSVLTIASGVLVHFNMKDEIINSGEKISIADIKNVSHLFLMLEGEF